MENLSSLISIGAIMELPWYVGIPGLLLVAVLLVSALRALFRFRLLKVITHLVLAFVILIILSRGGDTLLQLIGETQTG